MHDICWSGNAEIDKQTIVITPVANDVNKPWMAVRMAIGSNCIALRDLSFS